MCKMKKDMKCVCYYPINTDLATDKGFPILAPLSRLFTQQLLISRNFSEALLTLEGHCLADSELEACLSGISSNNWVRTFGYKR